MKTGNASVHRDDHTPSTSRIFVSITKRSSESRLPTTFASPLRFATMSAKQAIDKLVQGNKVAIFSKSYCPCMWWHCRNGEVTA